MMRAERLIGKRALRACPPVSGDMSFTRDPIRILAVTENHIVYVNERPITKGRKSILSFEWLDDNWTSYDDLMALASEEHIKLMQELHRVDG